MSEHSLNKNQGRASLRIRRVIITIILILISIMCLFWFVLLFVNTTRSNGELGRGFTLVPSSHLMTNFNNLFHGTLPIMNGMLNSFVIATLSAVCCVYFSTMTAYAVQMYTFKGKNAIITFILAIMMIPTQVTALGFINLVSALGLENNYIPLIIPSIAVQAIFTFVASWNNYFVPSLILHDDTKKTLPVLIAQLRSADWLKFDMGQVYAMISFSIFPVIIVYLILSKNIVGGTTAGGVKE
jgi:multiple sugar transport system permease protein